MRIRRRFPGLLVFALPALAVAQINLGGIMSRSARDWRHATTTIDSLWIESEVGNGQATTILTMVLNPGYYYTSTTSFVTDSVVCTDGMVYAKSEIPPDSGCGYYYRTVASNPVRLDSVEITLGFRMPTDFVAANLYLWVEGERQTGYIQDRALANQQYTQIVGRRLDPALLEFFGNGSYSLRIFPAATNKPRKVAIEFRHTFAQDTGRLITTPIPVSFASPTMGYIYPAGTSVPWLIGFVRASFTASDAREYEAVIPGVGRGAFSYSRNLTLTARSVAKLEEGKIGTADPTGASAVYAWAGRDVKTDRTTIGFAVNLSEQTLTFEPEPRTRILVFDIRNAKWSWDEYYSRQSEALGYGRSGSGPYTYDDVLSRAKKYALLSLNAYISPRHLFNVVIAGAAIKTVFGAPVEGSAENLAVAAAAILAATAEPRASTREAIRAAGLQAPKGVAILVSDLYRPYDGYIRYVNGAPVKTASGNAFDSLLARIGEAAQATGMTMFTVSDDWELSQISVNSGGYRLASLLYPYGVQYRYEVVDGRRVMIPIMPPLFGSNNPGGYRDITINGLDNAVYTFDGYSNDWWFRPVDGPMMMDGIRKTAVSIIAPVYASTSLLRVAGSGTPGRVTVTGKLGGLRFSRELALWTDYNPTISSHRPQVDKQWAFRKSEYLASQDWLKNALEVKRLGKEYHIVTRQTSLLALEPGMKLWEDTLWIQQQAGMDSRESAPMTVTNDAVKLGVSASYLSSGAGGGVSVDDVDIEQLMGLVSTRRNVGRAGASRIIATAQGRSIRLELPPIAQGSEALVRIFDARGRMTALKRIRSADSAGGSVILTGDGSLARGLYTVQVEMDGIKSVLRVSLLK